MTHSLCFCYSFYSVLQPRGSPSPILHSLTQTREQTLTTFSHSLLLYLTTSSKLSSLSLSSIQSRSSLDRSSATPLRLESINSMHPINVGSNLTLLPTRTRFLIHRLYLLGSAVVDLLFVNSTDVNYVLLKNVKNPNA